ncbi:hypothetical protein T4A_5459 [Trichinella pseudospiralis]|uniref:Uncharacterized protein n=1 Tax=Trichinella pseudospiralis TaxID=6337 RepID=A0A0V1EA58_TRIPS|nr:hypothetical protein T4A_5459 [Trichinella pseudospiralis]
MDVGHLLKIDPASTGATARRLSRGKSPLKGRGAGGGAGAVEPGLTLLLIPWRGSSKAAGLWYRNRSGINEFCEMANMHGVGLEIFKAGGGWRDQKRAPPRSVKLPSLRQGRMQTLPCSLGR